MNFKYFVKVYKVFQLKKNKNNQTLFLFFKELQSDTTGYNQALLQNLTPEQHTHIQNIIHYTEKRKQEKGYFYSLLFCFIECFRNFRIK